MTFDKSFAHVIGLEGGYTDGETGSSMYDPGGETKFGISKRAYPKENIKELTLDRAKILYKLDYWDRVKADELPSPLDSFMFDAAVNQGVEAAVKLLQKALGVAQDGVFGVDTMRKAKASGSELAALFMAERALRYTGTRNFDKYGRGWMKRLFVVAMSK